MGLDLARGVLATAVTIAYGADTVALFYLSVAGVMAVAQLATAREFFHATSADRTSVANTEI